MKYALLISAMLVFSDASGLYAGNSQRDEIDLIEDSIIVEGLSLTSDKAPSENEKDIGSVTFNDDLISEDPPAVKKVISDHRRKKSVSAEDSDDILRDLKKEDARWHYSRYLVKKGDTLWSIARKFNASHRLLVRINGMTKKETLRPGKKILVANRNGIEYKVRKGDTVNALAKRFKTDPSKIQLYGRNVKKLRSGSTVFISDAHEIAAPIVPKNTAERTEMIAKKDTPSVSLPEQKEAKIEKKEVALNSTPSVFVWPLQGRVTSGFGTRIDPFSKGRRFHNGVDISAEIGTPVHAAGAGSVIFSGWKDGYGNLIVIKHDNGYVSVYGHNAELKKKEGDSVEKGEVVSLSGMTGAVTGAHLHFEIQKYGTPLNPQRVIK